jgi:hypothetical protein
MPSIAKKIFATVTLVASAAMMASPAAALTAAELQAQIDSLLATIASLQAQLSAVDGGSGSVTGCTITSFTRNLTVGSSGADVKCLQIILNSNDATKVASTGAGSPGNESTYFGPLTKAAVIKYQNLYKSEVLTPLGLSAGTGYVGSATRTKLNTQISTGDGGDGGGSTPTTSSDNKVYLAADTPAAATVAKGAQNVVFAKMNVCTASQANTVSKVVVTRTGISEDADIAYIKLYDGATQVGASQALNSTTHKATFSSLNWTIPANSCKVLTVKATIAAGATQGDTPKLAINAATDITSTVALDGVFPITSNGMTIAGISTGWVEVTGMTSSPSGTVLAGGQEQAVAGFKFAASSTEAIKLNSVTVTEVGSSVDSDLSNIKLFYGSTQLGSTVASLSNGKATIDFSSTPIEVLAGGTKTLTLYADVGTSIGVEDRTVKFEITANTDVVAYGSNSNGQVVAYGATQATDLWPQAGAQFTVELGTLNVALDTTYSPSAQDYARGTNQNSIVAFKFTAGANEGVRITQIKLAEANSSLNDADISNITLYDAETGAVIGGPATQISGFVTFGSYTTGLDASGLFDLAKSTSKTVLVKADVSSAAATATSRLGFQITDVQTYIKADGLSSQNDLGSTEILGTDTIGVTILHNIIEKGTLTVGPSSESPSAATYAVGATSYEFARFDLTSTGEDMLVSQFNVYFATSTVDGATTTAADAADINNVKLYDGTTLLATDPTVSSGYANFSVNLTVAKNTTKTLKVVADVPTGSDAGALTAWVQTQDDVTVTGKDSAATITTTAASWAAVNGNVMTKGAPGVAVKAATVPATKTFIKNSTANLVTTLYLTASSTEDLKITKIRIAGDATASATLADGVAAFSQPQSTLNGYVVRNLVSNVKLYDGSTQVGSTVPTMTTGTNYAYADFTGLSLSIPKGTTKAIDVKVDVTDSTSTYFYFGVASSTDVAGSGEQSGTALSASTITMNGSGVSGQGMLFGSAGSLTVAADPDKAVSAVYVAGDSKVTLGSWKFTGTNEIISISKLTFNVTNSSAASSTSTGYVFGTTGLYTLATGTTYAFQYSIDDAATSECYFTWGAGTAGTTTAAFRTVMASASSTCASVIAASTTGTSIYLYATPTDAYSLEITDATATNAADDLRLGLKYGGTETIGKYDGANANFGAIYLYSGSTLLGTSYVGADTAGKVVFSFPSGSEVQIPVGSKILTMKADLSAYTSLTEGSTVIVTLGSTTNTEDVNYITAKGSSSGTTIDYDSINTTSAIGALESSEMWLYATRPVLSLNSSSPSGSKTGTVNQEVFRFDVNNAHPSIDLNINAIRFSITNAATSSGWDKTYNLYKSTDPSTLIGTAVSRYSSTTNSTTGWVAIYPTAGYTVGANTTATYILKADTSAMNVTPTGNDLLTISIEDGDFYWDDGLAKNANQKVSGLPVQGGTLTY